MKKIILLVILALPYIITYAQDEEPEKNKTIYSFVPQYLINRGIRVDIEKQLKPKHYLQICPQFYLAEVNENKVFDKKNEFSYLIGGGLNVYHKIFAYEDIKRYGLYLSYGLSYNHFNIDYIDYSEETDVSAQGQIHKFGAELLLGYQVIAYDVFSIDVYGGLGTRFSTMSADGADTDRFNTSYFGYNYSGNIIVLGLRIGVLL